jgi:SHS2 domain-containing protein
MIRKFRFLPHTADVYIEAFGKDLEETFANTALGLENIITNTKNVRPNIEKEINIQAEDEKALLFDFLTQFLILHDAENLVFSKIVVKKIYTSNNRLVLEASAWGEPFDPKKHESGTYVKAVSYMEMEIEKKRRVRIKVLIDI